MVLGSSPVAVTKSNDKRNVKINVKYIKRHWTELGNKEKKKSNSNNNKDNSNNNNINNNSNNSNKNLQILIK